MKKLLVAVAAVLVSVATYAQGTVAFDNLSLGVPILGVDGINGAGTHPGAMAGLYLLSGGSYSLVPNSTTTFFGNTGEGSKYLSSITVSIPGVAAGSPATVRVRAWAGGATTWEAAQIRGESLDIAIAATGGAGEPPGPPADMVNWTQGFQLVPEPSTIALGIIGGLALLLRRRK